MGVDSGGQQEASALAARTPASHPLFSGPQPPRSASPPPTGRLASFPAGLALLFRLAAAAASSSRTHHRPAPPRRRDRAPHAHMPRCHLGVNFHQGAA